MKKDWILIITCPDQKGIIARVSSFLFQHGANITHAEEHTDEQLNAFFMRIEWETDGFDLDEQGFERWFLPISRDFQMKWILINQNNLKNTAILVSKEDHCLSDLLYRYERNELRTRICLIISNHIDTQKIADSYRIPFHLVRPNIDDRTAAETYILNLLKKNEIDLVVLAKYMQILSPSFVKQFSNKIINIHHSFLPAFIGSRPYHQAHKRGVKIIGVTSHYVSKELDSGPIIEQDVIRISHKDTIEDLIDKGRDLEKIVLARAVKLHLNNRILVYANKTVVFN